MRQIRYAKQKEDSRPKVPSSIEEIHQLMTERFKNTCDGGQFLVCSDSELSDQFLLFISDHGKHLFKSYEHWSSDGTFSTCPAPFDQIYFIGIKTEEGKFIPAGYCLLKGKYRDLYRSVFETLIKNVGSVDHVQTFTMDFEQAGDLCG